MFAIDKYSKGINWICFKVVVLFAIVTHVYTSVLVEKLLFCSSRCLSLCFGCQVLVHYLHCLECICWRLAIR